MGVELRRVLAALAGCAAVMLVPPCAASGEAPCRVLDPELAAVYQGGCKDGLADGYGEAKGIAQYRGDFRAGLKHGKGVKIWPWGDRYEGEFVDDLKQGPGIYTWGPRGLSNGQRYVGEHLADRRHGFGTYTWPDGEVYAGQWRNDQIVGTPTSQMLERARVRARTEREAQAAIAMPGVKVCRQLTVGISERDWIRGLVVEASTGNVGVKIVDPGRFPHTLYGAEITRGALVWDSVTAWTPCSDSSKVEPSPSG